MDAGDHNPLALAMANANWVLLRHSWCKCEGEGDSAYFRSAATGTHGWMCAKCYGITQMG